MLELQNVSHINGVAASVGKFFIKMYGHFARPKQVAITVYIKVAIRYSSTVHGLTPRLLTCVVVPPMSELHPFFKTLLCRHHFTCKTSLVFIGSDGPPPPPPPLMPSRVKSYTM